MPETPAGSTADGVRQDVARLAELFRRSFAALDADARTAGQRWAGEINRELSAVGNIDLRADTRKALSNIQSLDRELSRDRALNIGADLYGGSAPGSAPGGNAGLAQIANAITAASAAAGGLAAAVGGAVGAVGTLGASASQIRDSGRTQGIASPVSVSGAMPSLGSSTALADAPATGSPGVPAAPAGFSGGAAETPAAPALAGLGGLVDGLARIGGAGAPGNVTVAPPNQPSVSGLPGVANTVGGTSGISQMPSMPSMPAFGDASPAITDSGSSDDGAAAVSSSPPAGTGINFGLPGLKDALTGVGGLTGGLPTSDLGRAMPDLSLPSALSGGAAMSNPGGVPSLGFGGGSPAATDPGAFLPGINAGPNGNGYPAGMSPGAAAAGTGGGGAGQIAGGKFALGGVGGDGLGSSAFGDVAGGRRSLTSGRIDMGDNAQGLGAPSGPPMGDLMASAPVGPAELSPNMPVGGDGNQLSLLGALFPAFAGVTNNQSNATFNINGGANQPGMDLFMSFWREFGRTGGLVNAVGSFLQ